MTSKKHTANRYHGDQSKEVKAGPHQLICIKFSFEFYDHQSDQYCLSSWNQRQVRGALLRLREISAKTLDDLKRDRRVLHFAEVDWEKTTKPNGFPDFAANALSPFHFALLGVNHQLARVYGAYYQDTFYIVWFDLNHEIWPSTLRHA